MNLRAIVVVLLLANLLLWAWTQGALQKWGWVPAQTSQSRPVPQQVRPEALDVRPLDDVVVKEDASKLPVEASPDPGWAPVEPLLPLDPADGSVDSRPALEAADDELAANGSHATEDGDDSDQARSDDAQAPEEEALAATAVGGADESVPTATDDEATSVRGDAAPPSVCWQAGPFNNAQAEALRRAAAASLPDDSWQLLESPGRAPRWMVYMGGMIDELEMLAKRNELHAAGVDVDRPGVGFEPGLSLGRYSSEAAAERALETLQGTPGVAGARVVQERAEETTYFLRAESAQTNWRAQLQQLPLAGRSLRHCP